MWFLWCIFIRNVHENTKLQLLNSLSAMLLFAEFHLDSCLYLKPKNSIESLPNATRFGWYNMIIPWGTEYLHHWIDTSWEPNIAQNLSKLSLVCMRTQLPYHVPCLVCFFIQENTAMTLKVLLISVQAFKLQAFLWTSKNIKR